MRRHFGFCAFLARVKNAWVFAVFSIALLVSLLFGVGVASGGVRVPFNGTIQCQVTATVTYMPPAVPGGTAGGSQTDTYTVTHCVGLNGTSLTQTVGPGASLTLTGGSGSLIFSGKFGDSCQGVPYPVGSFMTNPNKITETINWTFTVSGDTTAVIAPTVLHFPKGETFASSGAVTIPPGSATGSFRAAAGKVTVADNLDYDELTPACSAANPVATLNFTYPLVAPFRNLTV